MRDLFGFGGTNTVTESALLVLVFVIVALLIVTIGFSGYAIVLRAGHRRRDKLWKQLEAKWEGPVLAAIVDPAQVPAVHEHVPEKYQLQFVQFVLEYSRRVRGPERQTLRDVAEPYLGAIAERANHRRSEVRTRAIQTLGTLGLPKYSKEVLKGLEDPSPLVSMVAARYLARREYPQFAADVMKHLDRFHGWNRSFLASMLAAIGEGATPVLLDGLTDRDSPEWLRAVHAEALRMQMYPRAADAAAEALSHTDDTELSASLLRLLAVVGREEHIPIIRERCGSEDIVVRAQALHALGQLSDESEIPFLVEAMTDDSPWAALHAARGVRDAGGEKMLAAIAESDHPHARLAGQVVFEEDEP